MKLGWQPRKWLDKKSKLGFRGYPVGTVAFYGLDAQRASKVAVAVIAAQDTEPVTLHGWFTESGDVRNDPAIFEKIGLFLRGHEVHSLAMTEEILGCPGMSKIAGGCLCGKIRYSAAVEPLLTMVCHCKPFGIRMRWLCTPDL